MRSLKYQLFDLVGQERYEHMDAAIPVMNAFPSSINLNGRLLWIPSLSCFRVEQPNFKRLKVRARPLCLQV